MDNIKNEFLIFGVNTLTLITYCRFLLKQTITKSIDCLSLVGRVVVLGKFVRIILYFVSFV